MCSVTSNWQCIASACMCIQAQRTYLCGVGQLGTMCSDYLLQLEEQALSEPSKVPRHCWRCVQLQHIRVVQQGRTHTHEVCIQTLKMPCLTMLVCFCCTMGCWQRLPADSMQGCKCLWARIAKDCFCTSNSPFAQRAGPGVAMLYGTGLFASTMGYIEQTRTDGNEFQQQQASHIHSKTRRAHCRKTAVASEGSQWCRCCRRHGPLQ